MPRKSNIYMSKRIMMRNYHSIRAYFDLRMMVLAGILKKQGITLGPQKLLEKLMDTEIKQSIHEMEAQYANYLKNEEGSPQEGNSTSSADVGAVIKADGDYVTTEGEINN